jgi:transcriptional regulator with PAS, ATPase and Fis domain
MGDLVQNFLGMEAVVSSDTMRDVLKHAQRAALSEASILITGESGSGKELIARAIHHFSRRAAKPWVDVNCAALPEHLVESELFGYEKGAFSGADAQKPGLFELAQSGTLFLDEIGELDPRVQVKLLRVLDRVPYFRLGGNRKVNVDVRVVAATNRDLQAAVRQGQFRSDLYHRISQVRIDVPPLRKRPDDVAALARHFLKRENPDLSLSDDALERIQAYEWPGNVRELQNVIISSAVLALGDRISAANLTLAEREEPLSSSTPGGSLESMEREAILRVLDQSGGHHQKAAERLGISARTLSRKLKSYGMARTNEAPLAR